MDFQSSYNRDEFLKFLRNDFLGEKFEQHVEQTSITKEFKSSFFTSITKLGVVEEFDNLIVLEIEHKSKNDARISLTKDIFKLLRQFELEGLVRQNALVILKNSDTEQYRFSLLTTTYNEDFEEKLSNPKRYSFLLGKGEKTRTPENSLKNKVIDFKDLVERFNVEVVRKEFFNHYLTLYVKLYKAIIGDKDFVSLLKTQKVEIVSFTKNLLGKIVFLYFIQKKGWLGVEVGKEYGIDGDKNFMRSFWDDFKSDKKTVWENTGFFYNDYLEHLFYEGLNKDNRDDNDLSDYFDFKVPYLNGGLFKKDYEKWNKNESKIINDIFSNKTNSFEGDGILDIFDTYNFTIDEDDLYDSDIAIDPEMLGRIFEKMISISEENIDEILSIYDSKNKLKIGKEINKKFGAFYTPREIVHYMTKESIISYLVNNLRGNKEDKLKREEKEAKIRTLFKLKEEFLLNKTDLKDSKLSKSLSENVFEELADIIENIDNLLKKVKILDPAIGSGAFPMGILHEISSIRYYIYGVFYKTFEMNSDEFLNNEGRISMYKIKRDIIKNNIFGVDISSGAIDIARLRFWLSLVVDEEKPEPLPNFEFKFVCANTLIPLAEEPGQTHLEFEKELKVETLRKYMGLYYNADSNKDKEEYKRLIEKYLGFGKNITMDFGNKSERTKQLETYEPFNSNHSAEFFDTSLMMGNGKFDIVVGNPPYVSVKGIEDDMKKRFQKIYFSGNGRFNLFNLFIEKSLNLLNLGGVLSFIIPDGICSHTEYRHNREFIIENSNVSYINTFGKQVFDNASVDTVILSLEKNNIKNNKIKILNDLKDDGNYINQNEINNFPNFLFPVNLNKENKSIIKKGLDIDTKISSFLEIQQGIIYSGQLKEDVFSNSKISESYKKVLDGRDILKWKNNYNEKLENKYINYTNKLHRPREERIFLSNKIVFPRRSNNIAGTIDKEAFYALNTVYIGLLKEDNLYIEYILSILNSKYINFFYKTIFLGWQITIPALNFLPIPNISEEKQKPFIKLVDRILEITKLDFYDSKKVGEEQRELERKIDYLVYELYGLSDEEIKVVEDSL